jgi:hypothetical protein
MEIMVIVKNLVSLCKVLCLLTRMVTDFTLQINSKNITREVYLYIETLSSIDELPEMAEGYKLLDVKKFM